MKKIFFLSAFFLTATQFAHANDSAFEGVAGAPRPLKGEHRAIRMQSEKVVLTANAKDFTTRADFVFRNDSNRAVTVTMGFPEGTFGDPASGGPVKKSSFLSFATFVDGAKTEAKRTILNGSDAAGFDVYWLKTVKFAPRQTRNIRVLARSPYGGSVQFRQHDALSYEFTGQNWKGDVSRSDLEVHVPLKGLWTANMLGTEKPLDFSVETKANKTILRRTWRNWPAKQSVSVGLMRAIPFWLVDKQRFEHSSLDKSLFQLTKTFRVGPNDATSENYDRFQPDGFVREGVAFISLAHLSRRISSLNDNVKSETIYNAQNRVYQLKVGSQTLDFKLGNRQIKRSNGQSFTLNAAPILLRGKEDSSFYVPLFAVAKALNLKATANAKTRLLTLSR